MKCFIFDIDGTISDHSHRMPLIAKDRPGGKDWPAFHAGCKDDPPIWPVCDVVSSLLDSGWPILFITGRSSTQRSETEKWLTDRFGVNLLVELFMRPEGDFREDYVLKEEILDAIIAAGWNPVMAFEDRPRVCDMWHRRGLIVAKIGQWTEAQQSPASEAFAPAPVSFK